MYIKLLKDHPVGIKKGMCTMTDHVHGQGWITEGYAEKIDQKEYDKWVKDYYNPPKKETPKKKKPGPKIYPGRKS